MAVFLDQLARYEPADEQERRHLDDLRNLLRTAPDAFAREHFQPGHITASVFIVDEQDRVLLHHHRRLGRWLQMGGHIEPGETPLEAALREGAEESGLDDLEARPELLDIDIHLVPAGKGEPDHRHFDIRYLARTKHPDNIAADVAESIDLKWMSLDEAAVVMGSPESLRVIRKIAGVLCPS